MLLLTACVGGDEPELTEHDQALGGRVGATTDALTLSPFTTAYVDRATAFARTVSRSPAFASCVANTMAGHYGRCTWGSWSDPYPDTTREYQIARAWERFTTWNNNLEFQRAFGDSCKLVDTACSSGAECCSLTCAARSATDPTLVCKSDGAAAWADPQQAINDPYGTHVIGLSDEWHRDCPDWEWYAEPGRDGAEPWNWRADGVIHEYMHTLGYQHGERPSDCGGWFPGGAPNIYGGCADTLLSESERLCSGGIRSCPAGAVRLLSGWDGFVWTDQDGHYGCSCVSDPRHVIALRSASTGTIVTAVGGGGGAFATDWTAGIGAWQLLYAVDLDGGSWRSGDRVDLKVFEGQHVGWSTSTAQVNANTLTPRTVTIESGTTSIGNGTSVLLKMPSSSLYAYNNGTSLGVSSSTGTSARFTVIEPRRDHLVFLRTAHLKYVDADVGNGALLWNRLSTGDLVSDEIERQAPAGFWVVDWNGGELVSGDSISLQRYGYDSYAYVSVGAGDHTGQAVLVNEVGPYERFVITRADGSSGPILDTTIVALRSPNGTYLTAMPPDYFSSQIRNYSTYIGTWQRFTLRFVEQFDRTRPQW